MTLNTKRVMIHFYSLTNHPLYEGKKECGLTLFYPIVITMGKNSGGTLFFPGLLNKGEEEWGRGEGGTLFFPILIEEKKSEGYTRMGATLFLRTLST